MPQKDVENWRELCRAAFGGKDPNALLEVVRELNRESRRGGQEERTFEKGNGCSQAVEDGGSVNKYRGNG